MTLPDPRRKLKAPHVGDTVPDDGGPASSHTEQPENGSQALSTEAIDALQAALAAEQSAVWCYGLVAAQAGDSASTVAEMVTSHRSTRNVAVNLLTEHGATPVPPAAAYATPIPVDDEASALQLAIIIETDCAAAWRSAIGHTADVTIRGTALSALGQAALHLVTWRTVAGDEPVTRPFPGDVEGN